MKFKKCLRLFQSFSFRGSKHKISKKYLIPAFAVIVLGVVFNSCNTISTKTYTLQTPLLEEQSSIRIVLIADLHNTIYGKDQTILIDKVNNANPDLIVLAGDITHNMDTTGAVLLLAGISGTAPIYFVTGNHEYWSRAIQKILEEFMSYGVIVLSDTYEIVEVANNSIVLAGIEDTVKATVTPGYNQSEVMERVFRELDEIPLYKILIAHRPENVEIYKRYSFDLVLSGHTHGGQIRGLYAPNQGFFPKYVGGVYSYENLTLVVSRGLSLNHPRIPRIFNPPELVIVVIEQK